MPTQIVETRFTGADRLSPVLKKMGINVETFGAKATKSFRRATKGASTFRGTLGGVFLGNTFSRAVGSVTMGIRGMAEEYLDFDKSITKAVARKGLSRQSEEFKKFSMAARDEAAKTEFTAGQAGEAIEQMALAGFNATKSLKLLPGVLQLATNADVDVVDATKIAIKTMNAFGKNSEDTTQVVKSMTAVNDMLASSISNSTMDIEQLYETIKFVGVNARQAGQDMHTMAAVIGTLHDQTIEASTAGTQLRMAFGRMASPAGRASKWVKKLGIEIGDGAGNYANFVDIVASVARGLEGLGDRAKMAALKDIFGIRSMTTMNALVGVGADKLEELSKKIREADGVSEAMATTIRTSLLAKLQVLKSVLFDIGFKILEAFSGRGSDAFDDWAARLRKWDPKPIIEGLRSMAEFMGDLWEAVKPFVPYLPTFIALWITYKATMITLTGLEAAQFFFSLAKATKAAAGAQGLMNLIQAASPMLFMTMAVFGLVAALAILITKNKDVSVSWESMFADIEAIASRAIAAIIGKVGDLYLAISEVAGFFGFEDEKASSFALKLKQTAQVYRLAAADAERRSKETLDEHFGGGMTRRGVQKAPLSGRATGKVSVRPEDSIADYLPGFFSSFFLPLVESTGKQTASNQALNQQVAAMLPELQKRADVDALIKQGRLQAPNRAEAKQASQSHPFFSGRMEFANAPPGASFTQNNTGMKDLPVSGLGTQ
jgi:TP901 family phage tail tape measure protein